jgi:hypothetical protein
MIWGAGGCDELIRRYAARYGIIVVSSDRVPLPMLLGAVEESDATDWFPDRELGELVALGERTRAEPSTSV